MKTNHLWAGLVCASAGILLSHAAAPVDVSLEFVPTGAMKMLGGYIPQRLELAETKPEGLKKAPANLDAPLYGVFKFGPRENPATYLIILDEPQGKPSHLFVDANANGDLTDDPAPEWTLRVDKTPEGKELNFYSGGTTLDHQADGKTLSFHIPVYRFDKNDPKRAALAKMLFYYPDYGRKGKVALAGKTLSAFLSDQACLGDFRGRTDGKQPTTRLMLDLNEDGKLELGRESFPVDKPFNVGGTTYEIGSMTPSGEKFQIVESKLTVAETKPIPPPPAVGQKAREFEGKTLDGKAVAFPKSYAGKFVLLDFWATWCGPCIAELPNLTATYEKFHGQGFEVLGVSLDTTNMAQKVTSFTAQHKMPWPQIYDGKYWEAAIAKQYDVHAIPQAFLVDGDTGVVLATGGDVRGEKLAESVQKALAKKKENVQ